MVKRLLCAGCAAVLLAASLAGCGSTASPSASAFGAGPESSHGGFFVAMVKRLLCAGCAAVLLAASLAGCGSTASPSASASSAASASADPAMAGWEKYTASWYDVFDTVTTVIGYASSEEEWDRQMDMAGWEKYTASWYDVFDTVTTVIGYASSEEEWDRQMDALHQDLAEYHQLYDIYNHYEGVTNLYDLNRSAAQGPVAVDQRIMNLLVESREMYKTTSGQMNVAFGAVLSIWHDYREAGLNDPDSAQLPPMEQLTAASEHCSIDDLVLDEEAGTVYFADDQLQLDVGSVGKGYAVEMVARAAEERGLASAILSVGGNVRTIGHKPDGSRWTAGIQDPWASAELAGQVVNDAPYLVSVYMKDMALVTSGNYQRFYEVDGAGIQDPWASAELAGQVVNDAPYLVSVYMKDMALVTSGNYQRFYEVDGERYNHIIDPDTLMPADHFSAVAVLVPDSGLGDCLSTGLFCLPLEDGQALVESLDGVEAMWMLKDGSVVYSSGFGDSVKATLEGYEP